MQAISHITNKCLRYGQVHMCAIPSAGSIGDHGSHFMLTQKIKHILSFFFYTEPIGMSYFKKKLQIGWQTGQVRKQFILSFRRKRIPYLHKNRSEMFFETHNAS